MIWQYTSVISIQWRPSLCSGYYLNNKKNNTLTRTQQPVNRKDEITITQWISIINTLTNKHNNNLLEKSFGFILIIFYNTCQTKATASSEPVVAHQKCYAKCCILKEIARTNLTCILSNWIQFKINMRQAQPVWRRKSYNFKREAWEENVLFFQVLFKVFF